MLYHSGGSLIFCLWLGDLACFSRASRTVYWKMLRGHIYPTFSFSRPDHFKQRETTDTYHGYVVKDNE